MHTSHTVDCENKKWDQRLLNSCFKAQKLFQRYVCMVRIRSGSQVRYAFCSVFAIPFLKSTQLSQLFVRFFNKSILALRVSTTTTKNATSLQNVWTNSHNLMWNVPICCSHWLAFFSDSISVVPLIVIHVTHSEFFLLYSYCMETVSQALLPSWPWLVNNQGSHNSDKCGCCHRRQGKQTCPGVTAEQESLWSLKQYRSFAYVLTLGLLLHVWSRMEPFSVSAVSIGGGFHCATWNHTTSQQSLTFYFRTQVPCPPLLAIEPGHRRHSAVCGKHHWNFNRISQTPQQRMSCSLPYTLHHFHEY